jgi:hypothetical protein
MQYNETQLAKLIADVEKEFTAHLAKTESDSVEPKELESEPTVLAKAEEEKSSKPEEKKDEEPKEKEAEAKPEAKPESEEAPKASEKPAEAAPEAEAKPEGEAKLEEKPAMSSDESCDYDEEDMQHMQKMYSSMSKGELKAHHDCIANLAKCGDMSQEKAPMMKSEEITPVEVKLEEVKPSQETELLKSELSAANAKYDDLKKNFDAVAAFLTKLVEKKAAPAAKAITNLDVIAKSEGEQEEKVLTKGEVDSILGKKASDPSLKKADRDAINNYYLSDKDITRISHLLK